MRGGRERGSRERRGMWEQERKEWEETEVEEEERETEEGGEGRRYCGAELLSTATALQICYLHLPPSLSLSWLPTFIFLLMEGKEQMAAARNLCPDKRRQTTQIYKK